MADELTDEQRRYHSTVKERLAEDAKAEKKAAAPEKPAEKKVEEKS